MEPKTRFKKLVKSGIQIIIGSFGSIKGHVERSWCLSRQICKKELRLAKIKNTIEKANAFYKYLRK